MRGLIERIGWSALGVLVMWGALGAADVHAQAPPDMREIYPYLMLVIDSSGSMERLPACTCTTPGCEECLPDCDAVNVAGEPPKAKKNRWAVTLEALTGKFNDFQCVPLPRTDSTQYSFDYGYYLPYHQPWHCTDPTKKCDWTPTGVDQQRNGILDEYKGRVNFGLMTFDGWDTWVGAPPLVPANPDFNPNGIPMSEGESGLWSYGGPKSFHYPNCTTDYMMDTGARSPDADQGYLVSMHSCKSPTFDNPLDTCKTWCHGSCWTDDPSDVIETLNENIQEALLTTRPYGGTPIAASLDDLYYHFATDPNDRFKACRRRFALLMTDGYPDDDYRTFGCDCKEVGDCPAGLTQGQIDQMHCPYPLPEDAAKKLVQGTGSEPPRIEQLFVVGLAVDDTAVLNRLDAIAVQGCTKADRCVVDGHSALFADDLPTLVSTMSSIIQGFLHPISRSVPVFAGANASGVEQYQISTGFDMNIEDGAPRTGVIERRRFGCDATGELTESPIDGEDLIHETINTQATTTLNLLTAVPQAGFDQNRWVFGRTTGTPCGTPATGDLSGCKLVSLKDSTISNTRLGLVATDDAKRLEIMDWMYGENNSVRVGRQLGDIYHSSPVIMAAPKYDAADEAFNVFRAQPIVKDRPLTMFVGTNDGMLRAIAVEAFHPTSSPAYDDDFDAGEQMWGFVPPMLLQRLQDNLTDHRITMDGTPVVKDVYFKRSLIAKASANASDYHTVLISGMRGGGNGYIALDVTDPTDPKFLWQFTDPLMGRTYAQPAIAQATWRTPSGSLKNGAVAILSGGVGQVGNSGVANDCVNGTNPQMLLGSTRWSGFPDIGSTTPARDLLYRTDFRCWESQGRALYFIDVETGELIKRIARDASNTRFLFPVPLVSTPVIFQNEIGTAASRAFVVDAAGVIWRIDLGTTEPQPNDGMKGWTARPFHDIFWDSDEFGGEVSYETPVMSVDELGRVVVIVGTGDTDNFLKTSVRNKVVSVTEVIDKGITALEPADSWAAALNWEKVQKPGSFEVSELVTGSMGLFAGQLYFGSFIGVSGADCDYGRGRVHAVDYVKRDINDRNPVIGSNPPTYGPVVLQNVAVGSDSTSLINVTEADAEPNLMIMGLGITQRPTCDLDNPNLNDPWGQKNVVDVSSDSEPALFLVAQGSGDSGTNSVLRDNAGAGRLLNVQLEINRPKTKGRVLSWATSVD